MTESKIDRTYLVDGRAELDCDVVIIGSGAGGSSVAAQLIQANLSVVMLEEGPYIPASRVPPTATESFEQMWRGAGLTVALGRPPISYAEGRCVGGGTEINSAIFQRAPEALLVEWAEKYEIQEFSAEELAPYFDEAARQVNASLTPDPLGRASDVLKQGADKLDWKVSALERAQSGCVGTNLCAFGCPTGGKQSMTREVLPDALDNGLELIAECRVRRVDIRGRRVTSVKATATDKNGIRVPVTVNARQAIFVCAGAIHSPALLQRSGIGERRFGRSLRLHPMIRVLAEFPEPINSFQSRLPLFAVTEFMPDQRIGGSIMTPAIFGMAMAEDWELRRGLISRHEHVGGYYAMVRAEGTGTVRTLPGFSDPLVRYTLTRRDWRQLTECLARLVRVMFAAGAVKVYPSIQGHPGWSSSGAALDELSTSLRPAVSNLMTIHLFSSCPMGEHERCAFDSYGRFKELENLFVADASVIPEAPGVNPQGTVMALAQRSVLAFLRQGG